MPRMQLQGMAQVMDGLVYFCRPILYAQRAPADFNAHVHTFQRHLLTIQGTAPGFSDAVAFFFTINADLNPVIGFQKGQGRINHTGTWAVSPLEQGLDVLNQVIPVTGVLGNQCQ